VWLSRADQADAPALERLRALAWESTGRGPVASRHAPVDVVDAALARSLGKDALRGARVLLLSGLARSGAFRRTVEALGAEVAAERAYPDHHRFTDAELDEALRAADAAGCARVVMTEKDAVRLPAARAGDARLCAVRIVAEIVEGEGNLDEVIGLALNPSPNPNTPPNPTATPTSTRGSP
jgi:tetraacyldisaccharide 4'-kinase